MKRLLVSLSMVFGLVTASYAAIPIPKDSNNSQVFDPRWAGASVCDIGASSTTADILCGTGPGIVFGIIHTSGTSIPADFLTFRDTATANHSQTLLGAATSGLAFPVSIKFSNGLCITNSGSAGTNEHWGVLYRLQSNQN